VSRQKGKQRRHPEKLSNPQHKGKQEVTAPTLDHIVTDAWHKGIPRRSVLSLCFVKFVKV
jgi:hypothetical protein